MLSFYICLPHMTIIWCMVPEISSVADIIFCHFGLFFALLYPYSSNNPENQKFKKMNRNPGDIILHMSNINKNHMMYDYWDMECNRQNFFLILDHFLPFYPSPLNNPKN